MWQGFFFVVFIFAFCYWASSSVFPSELIFLWQAGIVRLRAVSSSSSSSCCPVVDFVFGFLLRLSHSASSLPSSSRLRLVLSFNGASRSPSSGFVCIISAIKIALMLSSSGSSRHPLLPVPLILFILFITSCVLGVMILIGDRCAVDLCLWAQEI